MTDTRIALLGAGGRMGQAILAAAPGLAGVRISAALVRAGSPLAGRTVEGVPYGSDLAAALAVADVMVDFSVPASTLDALDACVAAGKPMVTGVTGLDTAGKERIQTAGRRIPVLAAPNMSLGVALLTQLAATAARTLGPDFDIAISETHHRHKRDAPSGTALALADAMSRALGQRQGNGAPDPYGPGTSSASTPCCSPARASVLRSAIGPAAARVFLRVLSRPPSGSPGNRPESTRSRICSRSTTKTWGP